MIRIKAGKEMNWVTENHYDETYYKKIYFLGILIFKDTSFAGHKGVILKDSKPTGFNTPS